MASSNFVDYVKIYLRSGDGGGGSMHFHRSKGNPKGGPDGGDGGRGGHIIVKGNQQLWTLLHLRYTKHLMAGDGEHGSSALRTGANGKDLFIEVPLGTVIRDAETGEMVNEVTAHDETHIIVPGGRGGLGNDHFKTAVNQAPKYAQPGEPGIETWMIFELKLLADVGLVGFPNAGKSTLLSVISAAKPEIADYPFTTLRPNLGIVSYYDDQSFIVADIPGIIEGAHQGKGLGVRFLRHIERNSVLLFLVPADSPDIRKEYEILVNELRQFNPELMSKTRLLAISKSDLLDEELKTMMQKELPAVPLVFISSHTRAGLPALKEMLWKSLHD